MNRKRLALKRLSSAFPGVYEELLPTTENLKT